MTATSPDGVAAETWAATWISGPCPVEGFGNDSGYAVAWVQVDGGARLQALVSGADAPAPGTRGWVKSHDVGDESIDVFSAQVGASA
jgi:hypothetical protein